MTQKEINQAIYDKIAEIAQGLLERSKFPEGSHTAQQIAKSKIPFEASKEDIENWNWDCAVEVGEFKCAFHPSQVFDILQKFASKNGCRQAKKFVKTAPTEKPNAKTAKAKVEQKQAPVIPMIPKATNATETQKVQVAANDTARTRERPKAYYSF